MRARTFEMNKQLTPSEVYCAAVGMFEVNGFELVEIVEESMQSQVPVKICERARVYRNPRDNQLHVLYFPGKDNDYPMTDSDTTTSLGHIKRDVADECKTKLAGAIHSMVVCESNRFYGFKVDHYIYASLEDGKLTTDDSINRDYDESYVERLIPHDVRDKKKRGWQRQVFDKWQCGHFVLQALHRKMNGFPDPIHLQINENIVDTHDDYYQTGKQLVKRGYDNPHQTTLPKRVIDDAVFTSTVTQDVSTTQTKASDTHDDDLDELLREPSSTYTTLDETSALLPIAKKKPGLMQRYPWIKTALIGFGIGLLVTGIVLAAAAITVATMGAGAPAVAVGALAAGAIIGAKFGLAGAAATGVGLTAVAVGAGALCATTSGIIGAAMGPRKSASTLTSEQSNADAFTNSQARIRSVTHANLEPENTKNIAPAPEDVKPSPTFQPKKPKREFDTRKHHVSPKSPAK